MPSLEIVKLFTQLVSPASSQVEDVEWSAGAAGVLQGDTGASLRALREGVAAATGRADQVLLLLVEGGTVSTLEAGWTSLLSDLPAASAAVAGAATQVGAAADADVALFPEPVSTVAYIPVAHEGVVAGLFAIGWRSRRGVKAAELARVEQAASRSFPAVALLLVQKRLQDAEADAHILMQAAGALSGELTVLDVAAAACLHARRIARARTARLGMIMPNGTVRVLSTNPGHAHHANATIAATADARRAMDEGRTIVEDLGHRLTVHVPVRQGRASVGVLQLAYRDGTPPPPERLLRLCEGIAAQTGVALERAERADELRRLAITDALTGLGNRRHILHDLRREIARARRKDEPLCIAMVDIDNFKAFNDAHGHVAGDRHLAAFGAFLDAGLRAMDAAGRYGGEEFLLLLPSSELGEAFGAVERLRREWAEGDNGCTFSAGVASVRPDESRVDLVMRADRALYGAKENGRNCIGIAEGDVVVLTSIDGDADQPGGDVAPETAGTGTDSLHRLRSR